MPFKLSPLPFSPSDLEPTISRQTIHCHYEKHHAGYVKKLNDLTKNMSLADMTLEHVIRATTGNAKQKDIFNNAAQVWNHDFLWRCMAPSSHRPQQGALALQIDRTFGSLLKFAEQFTASALHHFGSGWTWLVLDKGKLRIVSTPDAALPMIANQHALLTCDVWEHAYYLDYKNDREQFVRSFLDKLVNWQFVAERLEEVEPVH